MFFFVYYDFQLWGSNSPEGMEENVAMNEVVVMVTRRNTENMNLPFLHVSERERRHLRDRIRLANCLLVCYFDCLF